jgi:hypothetical protein
MGFSRVTALVPLTAEFAVLLACTVTVLRPGKAIGAV